MSEVKPLLAQASGAPEVRVRCRKCGRVLVTDRELGVVPNLSRPDVVVEDAAPQGPLGTPWEPWSRVTIRHRPRIDPRTGRRRHCPGRSTLRWDRLQERLAAARLAGRRDIDL